MFDPTSDLLSIPYMLKATPAEEGGRRYVYLEAANEATDQQNEVVLAKALADSAPYFLRYGNLDLDHITLTGPKKGIPDYPRFEIGQPRDVRVAGPATFVKGEIYQGDAKSAECANTFWDSITKQSPPQRWFPSVGGAVLDRGSDIDPATGRPRGLVKAVRWTNIGFSRTPVNQTVPTISTVPFGVLAKCMVAAGFDFAKALDSGGYQTDSASLAGGGALREQSLDGSPQNYWDFRDRLASDIRRKRVRGDAASLVKHAADHYGVGKSDAAGMVARFLGDLKSHLKQGKS